MYGVYGKNMVRQCSIRRGTGIILHISPDSQRYQNIFLLRNIKNYNRIILKTPPYTEL